MSSSQKVYLIIIGVFLSLAVAVIISVSYQFYTFGYQKAKENATTIAQAVREGLTAHMINGTMDKRHYYINNMTKLNKIENLRILRSQSVVEQFGKGSYNESSYDKIDRQVLKSAKPYYDLISESDISMMRVTIPYIVTQDSEPNCLKCHDAQNNDVLGAISMEVDISDIKDESISSIIQNSLISLLFLVISVSVASYYIRKYIQLFNDLSDGINSAYHGDFSYHINTKLKDEAGDVAKRLNELSDIFLFKKTIEADTNKKTIYARINKILHDHFDLERFYMFEVSDDINSKAHIYSNTPNTNEKLSQFKTISECRTSRTKDIVASTDFPDICGNCCKENTEYVCMSIELNQSKRLILNIELDSKEDVKYIKDSLPIIKNYIDTARPIIESKLLTEALEETALRDPLTGMHNRRYLDIFIENSINLHVEYCAVMFDIDLFKSVNDSHGHDVGDRVIQKFAKTVVENIKGNDMAIRYGGEEFLVILFDIELENAKNIIEKIRREFSILKFDVNDGVIQKTVSAGLAEYPKDNDTHWKVIKDADTALYKAKKSGRNKLVIYNPDMIKGE